MIGVLQFRYVNEFSTFPLLPDLGIESASFCGIDLLSCENVRHGDSQGDGSNHQRCVEPVHAGSNEVVYKVSFRNRNREKREKRTVHQHARHHRDDAGYGQDLMRRMEYVHGLDAYHRH